MNVFKDEDEYSELDELDMDDILIEDEAVVMNNCNRMNKACWGEHANLGKLFCDGYKSL